MLEKYNLNSLTKEIEDLDLDINEANEDIDVSLIEVYRKEDLILYECINETEPTISNDIIAELFPNFEIDPMKRYLIEKDGEIFIQ